MTTTALRLSLAASAAAWLDAVDAVIAACKDLAEPDPWPPEPVPFELVTRED